MEDVEIVRSAEELRELGETVFDSPYGWDFMFAENYMVYLELAPAQWVSYWGGSEAWMVNSRNGKMRITSQGNPNINHPDNAKTAGVILVRQRATSKPLAAIWAIDLIRWAAGTKRGRVESREGGTELREGGFTLREGGSEL